MPRAVSRPLVFVWTRPDRPFMTLFYGKHSNRQWPTNQAGGMGNAR
jgi:hypothetical protein